MGNPVEISCPSCKGIGYKKCPACDGTGKTYLVEPKREEEKICISCSGKGKLVYYWCGGKGKISA